MKTFLTFHENAYGYSFSAMEPMADLNAQKMILGPNKAVGTQKELKKSDLDQIEKYHEVEIPQNLLDNEIKTLSQSSKDEKKDESGAKLKLAKSRIKLGLLLNEFGEKNNIKVNEDEIKNEIQKQVKSMPGQEKFVFEYYQKNPSAAQHLRGALYEEKIITLIKSKINLSIKEISTKEAEELITNFNNKEQKDIKARNKEKKPAKIKKISKK